MWAAPKHLRALQEVAEAVSLVGMSHSWQAPEDLDVPPRVPRHTVPDFVDLSLQRPAGPPPPQPMCVEIDNATQHTQPAKTAEVPFPAWVATVGQQPIALQLRVGIPSDIEDAIDLVERSPLIGNNPCCDRVIAVRPQPFPTCAAFVRAPDWLSYSSLSLVCLDLRDAVPDSVGPVIAAYVTRPTSLAELQREAGAYGTSGAKVFVGSDVAPLQEDESIVLSNGIIVTFMCTDRCPYPANDLQYRLQFPDIWSVPAVFPTRSETRASLLLLHASGRYLLGSRPSGVPADVAAARFVGVDRAAVNFHTPRDGCLRDFLYKGAEVRGVIAITEAAADANIVVFLDLRQLAEGISFVTLDRPYVLTKDLPEYFSRQPPPSWVLRVEGGARRGDRIEVQHGDTLVLGFQYVPPESGSASPSDAPPPDEGSDDHDDADDDPSDESAEDESADEDSETSTRSRSRHRQPRAGRRGSSSDRSYQGDFDSVTFPFEGYRGWLGIPCGPHSSSAQAVLFASTAVTTPKQASRHMPNLCNEAMLKRIARLRQVFGVRLWPAATGVPLELYPSAPQATIGSCALRTWVSRLLTEPVDAPGPGRSVIRDLADVTRELGGRWPYFPLQHSPGAAPPLSEGSDDETYVTTSRVVTFFILTPDFAPEKITVEVTFPAVTADILPLLQQARSPERQARFPHLATALPQSCTGIGMYAAAPHWNPDAVVVIFDLLAVDGRLYAAIAPAYVDRSILCDIADVPEAAALSFYVGISGEPLTGDAMAHLVLGIVVIVLPDHDPSPTAQVLQQMLLFPDMWRVGRDQQQQGTEGVYCLVHEHRHRRFVTDFREPLQYRQQLARAVGAEGMSVHIAPAVPRVTDAEIDGIPCHTAIAVRARGEQARGRTCLVIVDCRALLEGWMSWLAYDGLVVLAELLHALRFSVPPGWEVTVTGARAEGLHLHVEPGQVLVADYIRGHTPLPLARAGSRHASVTEVPTPDDGDDVLHLDAPTVEAAVSAWQRRLAERPLTGNENAGSQAAAFPHNCHALVFAPEYLAELYELHVTFPQTLAAFHAQVASRRCPDDCRRFPTLVPVFPQPDGRFATFVAVPAWPTTCQTVFVASRQVDGRLFAVCMPEKVDFASVLAIADFSATVEVQLLFRDMPWPVDYQTHLHVATGDLFTITPVHSDGPVRVPLQDMLRSSDGWDIDDPFIYEPSRRLCIVTEAESFLHEVTPPRRACLGADLAAATGIARANLIICPAMPHIWDHMDRGRMVRQVLIPLEHPADAAEASEVPFLLDLRPIQLGFQTAWAPATGYDVAALARRLAGFCPEGFRVVVLLAQSHTRVANALSVVGRGEVLCVEFERQSSTAEAPPDTPLENPLDTRDAPPSSVTFGGSLPRAARGVDPAQPIPGQGGQSSSPSSSMRHPFCSDTAKCYFPRRDRSHVSANWNIGLWLLCCIIGLLLLRRGTTDVLLLAQLCLLSFARPHGHWLVLCGVLAFTLGSCTAEAMPMQQLLEAVVSDAKGLSHLPVPRRIATPCRSLKESHGPDAPRLFPGVEGDASLFSVADLDTDRCYLNDLHTVLEDCVAASDEWAFLAATLLDTLIEHHAATITSGATKLGRVVLELEPVVHVSAFQRHCLELQHLLPTPIADVDQQTDWLDNDLTGVLHFRGATLTQRRAFASICKWHDECPRPPVLAVEVFTDGSASGHDATSDIAPAGWAFTVWLRTGRCFFFGAASGTAVPPDTRYYIGETQDSPLQSELLALCWALVWITEYGPAFRCPVHIHYDCQAAGFGTFGLSHPAVLPVRAGECGLGKFAVVLRQCAQRRVQLEAAYVQGHAGILGNELSDCFAKLARTQQAPLESRMLPDWPHKLSTHPLVDWAWLVVECPEDMPRLYAFEATAACLQSRPAHPRPAPVMGVQPPSPNKGSVKLHLRCMTYNVLTLLDKPSGAERQGMRQTGMRIKGKRHLLVRQCLEDGINIVGLQETRLQDTAVLPDAQYVMLHSAATAAGHLGCALWLGKTTPYATCDGRPLHFDAKQCTVTALSSRHLLVNVTAPHLHCLILVAHSPADPKDEGGIVTRFWRERSAEIAKIPGAPPLIVLTDANGRLGTQVSPAVGPVDAEEETAAGGAFHDFLLRHHLCAPATFGECHSGASWTWCGALGGRHRLDYVAIPQSWMCFDLCSSTWPELETLQKRYDHIPARLNCVFGRVLPGAPGLETTFRRRACRPNDLDPALDRARFLASLQGQPLPSWDKDVDLHFEQLVRNWTDAGRAVEGSAIKKPRQSFLTNATMELVEARKAIRRYLKQEESELQRRRKLIGFAAFILCQQGRSASAEARHRAAQWVQDLDVSIARAWSFLDRTGRALRSAVQSDRNNYLDQLVRDVGLADVSCPKKLFRRVRQAFPKAAASRRTQFTALPAVELEDGSLATSCHAREQRWRDHFATQESGTIVDAVGFQKLVAKTDADRSHRPPCFDSQMLPSLPSLESIVLGLKRAKAAGADGISAELLRVAPLDSARRLVALHLKCVLSLREPVEFKGGSLMTLAKRASAAFGCNKYRSILLSSVPGKVFHRELRNKLSPALQAVCPELHGGVRPGIGVDTISLVVKSFQLLMHRAGWLPAVVFYDVRAAYYQVLRECLVGGGANDRVLLQFFHRLGVPSTAIGELKDHLSKLAFLVDSGCSTHAVSMIQEIFVGTWFRLDHTVPLVATEAGVRPGDPLADLLFAITFSAYAKSVGDALTQAGLETVLPASKAPTPWGDANKPIALGPASWADDFAALHRASTPSSLVHVVRAATEMYLTHATSNGIELAFAPDKTAAVLPPRVSFQEALGLDRDGDSFTLPVRDGITGHIHQMPVVQAYKHLGGIVTSAHTVVPEIHFRHSQACWTLRPLRGTLFGNPSSHLGTRRHLLQALVVSKFVFGSATLVLSVAGHFRLWARLYTALFRALQPKTALQGKLHSYAVLGTAAACTPPLALAKARAGFLSRLLRFGPATLRQLLWLHWEADPGQSWFGQVLGDIKHVSMYCAGAKVLLHDPCPVTALLTAVSEDAAWWRRQVQAAVRVCLQDLRDWKPAPVADTTADPAPYADVPDGKSLDTMDFECPMCPAKFPLRKHLGVHLARAHAVVAPARLYSPHPTCVACLRYFHTLPRLQQHFKSAKSCLLRAAELMPPMTLSEVKTAELTDKTRLKKLKAGGWQHYTSAPPILPAFGPHQPSRGELRERLGEDAPLSLLADPAVDLGVREWVQSEASYTTKEPKRTGTASFWSRRVGSRG